MHIRIIFAQYSFFFSLLILAHPSLFPCTTAVISSKATPDGRPILWKHRDSSAFQNKLRYFEDGVFSYIGLINSSDSPGEEVWAGTNSAGFSIINSASYNLKIDETELKDQEGTLFYCHYESRFYLSGRSNLLAYRGLLRRSCLTPRNDNRKTGVFVQALIRVRPLSNSINFNLLV